MVMAAVFVGFRAACRAQSTSSFIIRADGSIDPSDAPVVRNYDLYTLTGNVIAELDGIVVEKDNIILDGSGYTVTEAAFFNMSGVSLEGRSNVTVRNVSLRGFRVGFLLNGTNLNNIVDCDVESINSGVELFSSSGNIIIMNNISSCYDGISLNESSSNTISGNNLESNYATAIALLNSSNYNVVTGNVVFGNDEGLTARGSSNFNFISGNNVDSNFRGFESLDSSNNTLAGNTISNSGWFDFRLLRCSFDAVYENNFTGNEYIIWLDSSQNNSFFHNFIGLGGAYFTSSGYVNAWDYGYPSGGNFWFGHAGIDLFNGPLQNQTGSDGLFDSALVLNANNTDHYPLAGTYFDFNVTSRQRVSVTSNDTVSYGGFNGTAIQLDVFGDGNASGFCRIDIPFSLLNPPFRVFINGSESSYSLLPSSDSSMSYVYVSYGSLPSELTVIPEAPLIMPVFLLALLFPLLFIARRKRGSKV